jgi:hypothetical protein
MGKAALAAAALSALLLQVDLAAAGPKLDAAASDPTTIGWMLGSPPAPDKMVLSDEMHHLVSRSG